MTEPRSGPLRDLRIVEFTGIGPAPLAAMLLADMGAHGAAHRPHHRRRPRHPGWTSSTSSPAAAERGVLHLDLKGSTDAVRDRADPDRRRRRADRRLSPRRDGAPGPGPGLGVRRNPRMVYGRVTGGGSKDPSSQVAGHDLNYIALTGALHAIGAPATRRCRR